MKIGFSSSCYRWQLEPPRQLTYVDIVSEHRVSGRPIQPERLEFNYLGEPINYFSGFPPFQHSVEKLIWMTHHAKESNCSVFTAGLNLLEGKNEVDQLAAFLERHRVQWIPIAHINWVGSLEEFESEWNALSEPLHWARQLKVSTVTLVHSGALIWNHFSRSPAIEEQLGLIIRNFRALATWSRDLGMTFALENHMDYRASELAQVLREVNAPHIRATFDTGNPVSVLEDSVEAARHLSPFSRVVHLKDLRIQPLTIHGVPMIFGCPLGEGNINLKTIWKILQQESQEDLIICVDLVPHRTANGRLWLETSLRFVRHELCQFKPGPMEVNQ